MDTFSDEFLAYLELKQDMFFSKIPTEKIHYYIETALEIGREYGKQYAEKSVQQLYQENQINIQIEEHDGEFFKVKLRAQFETDSKGHNQVYLYKQSIRPLAVANKLTEAEMTKIILAHEFFHFVEYGLKKTIGEQLAAVETFRLLGLSRKAHITRASEIAANAFTKTLLGLPYLPNYYDYHFLVATEQMTIAELEVEYELFQQLE